tara:strand:+ start:235 stop:966 length:732 start_codon:yes stop_codon:yes gene_type:complete
MAAGTVALAGMAVSAASQGIAAGRARRMGRNISQDAQAAIAGMNVPDIINPYAGVQNLSELAEDLSGQMFNPYSNIGVATQAAKIQAEEADIALANTLDTLRATGASAGGATALAQAALKSKQGVAATIEKQEAENERLRAQGEAMLQDAQIKEQQRIQGVEITEGQRVQEAEARGLAFQFQAEENRYQRDMDYYRSLQNFGMRQGMQSMADQWGALGGFAAGVGQMGAQGMFSGMDITGRLG